jgi:hypothetical protein
MKSSRVERVLAELLAQRWPVFIWGAPGVGKSAVVRRVAEQGKLPVIDLRASLLDPTDLRGIPAIDAGRAIWCPPVFLPKPADLPGILFLDELNAAPSLVQAALYQLVLDRQVGEYRLPDGWRIVAAGNRQTDRAVVFRLSSALANRFIHLDFEVNVVDWRDWAIEARVHPLVVGFIGTRPNLLLGEPGEGPAYPTPRSWEMVSDAVARLGGVAESEDVIPGIVGAGAAAEFQGYATRTIREEDFLRIVEDPAKTVLPTALGDVFAMTSWFAYHAKDDAVRRAGATLLSRIPPEFGVILARDLLKAAPSIIRESGYKAFINAHGELFLG